MKTVIQVVLIVAIVVLSFFLYQSIMEPIRFNREKDLRYSAAIERLKDIRTAQVAFKAENGRYTGSFDTLISFLRTDSFRVVKAIGFVPDTLTEAQAIKMGIVSRDTIRVSVLDSLFKTYPVDSLRYAPYTNGVQFTMGASSIETGAKVKVPVFEASISNDILLKGLSENSIQVLDEQRKKITGFGGLRVGSLEEANNNAGNWE